MRMITARQAIPGTEIRVCSSDDWKIDPHAKGLYFSWIIVDHWSGNGNGTATLYGTTGQAHGIYKEDDLFPVSI